MVRPTKALRNVCGVEDNVGKPLCNNYIVVRQLRTHCEGEDHLEYEHQGMILPRHLSCHQRSRRRVVD